MRELVPVVSAVAPLLKGQQKSIYPDLPGMGRTSSPPALRSADDVLDLLLGFAEQIVGHSAYYAQGLPRDGPTGSQASLWSAPFWPASATSPITTLWSPRTT